MRFFQTVSQLAVLASAACAAVVAATEPKLDVSASFADDNPFGRAYAPIQYKNDVNDAV